MSERHREGDGEAESINLQMSERAERTTKLKKQKKEQTRVCCRRCCYCRCGRCCCGRRKKLVKKAQLNLSVFTVHVQCFTLLHIGTTCKRTWAICIGHWTWMLDVADEEQRMVRTHPNRHTKQISNYFRYFVCFSSKLLKTRTLAADSLCIVFFRACGHVVFEVPQLKMNKTRNIQNRRSRSKTEFRFDSGARWLLVPEHEITNQNKWSERN